MTRPSHLAPNDRKLKIGLLVNSESVPQHIYDLAQWCQQHSLLTISHLLVMDQESIIRRTLTERIRRSCLTAIIWLEKMLLKRAGKITDNPSQSLNVLIPDIIRIKMTTDTFGCVSTLSAVELDKIKALQLDVILMMGTGRFHGEINNTAALGVISPIYCDETEICGGPAGFWEVFYNNDCTRFSIRHQCKDTSSKNDIVSGRIKTQNYFLLNRMHIRQKCLHYMKEALNSIACNRQMPPCSSSMPTKTRTQGMPSLFVQVKYISALGHRLVSRFVRNRLKMDFKWNVAYKKSDWKSLAMETSVKIPNPKNHFLADPFVVSESGLDYCFLEDYDYSTQKGHIAVYQLHADSAECLGNALIEPYHLSFPYLFRYKSELYMCPETSRNRQIRIYKCVSFPLQWQLHTVLMDDVSAADTMLFERDGRWWMLTNMDVAETGDYCTELCIYWADSPLSTQWTSHAANPIFIDATKGRNAGLLFDDTNIYRVAQKQGFDFYGKGFTINRIDLLDENNYRETEIRSVQADFFPNLKGTHHMHCNGGITVFDFIELQKM